MSKIKKHVNVIKSQLFKASGSVYYTYLLCHEAKPYKNKLIGKYELPLKKFQEDGLTKNKTTIEDEYINKELLQRLKVALDFLAEEEKSLFVCFFL